MNQFDKAFVLSRVLNTGVIMSIEKNEKELPGLERILKKSSGYPWVSLFNSVTGAIHGAFHGQGLGHGDSIPEGDFSEWERRFIQWLGVDFDGGESATPPYKKLSISPNNVGDFKQHVRVANQRFENVVLDFSPLGFGPSAALLCKKELTWQRAERLKIFGAFDLRTMWTQQESCKEITPAVQFNYRLSPLVAACVRTTLLQFS